eukprot:GHRQ01019586.1.p1 GENE.GHRQ01019586.1~~GHRQ01019586.1.p1  ORF type:complete len:191 (-),score=44.59 GHRQ01019586.1:382-954(-)
MQITTRTYEFKTEGAFMIPFVDLAKRYNGCTNSLAVHRCGPIHATPCASNDAAVASSDDLCIYWRAGSDIAADEDLCLAQGYLLPDRALLQFGFVLSQPPAVGKAADRLVKQQLELSAVDRHDLPAAVQPWQFGLAQGPPPAFAGACTCASCSSGTRWLETSRHMGLQQQSWCVANTVEKRVLGSQVSAA